MLLTISFTELKHCIRLYSRQTSCVTNPTLLNATPKGELCFCRLWKTDVKGLVCVSRRGCQATMASRCLSETEMDFEYLSTQKKFSCY